jgi:hypothetical protein
LVTVNNHNTSIKKISKCFAVGIAEKLPLAHPMGAVIREERFWIFIASVRS